MRKCICCKHQSKSIMGPKCAALKCKCNGVKCPHDGARLRLYKLRFVVGATQYPDLELAKCNECGCAWTGHPDNSTLQSSFTCDICDKLVRKNISVPVLVS